MFLYTLVTLWHLINRLANPLTVCLPALTLCPILLPCKFLTCRNSSCFMYCPIPTAPGTLQAVQTDLLSKARHEYLSASLCWEGSALCSQRWRWVCIKPPPQCCTTAGQMWTFSDGLLYFPIFLSLQVPSERRPWIPCLCVLTLEGTEQKMEMLMW